MWLTPKSVFFFSGVSFKHLSLMFPTCVKLEVFPIPPPSCETERAWNSNPSSYSWAAAAHLEPTLLSPVPGAPDPGHRCSVAGSSSVGSASLLLLLQWTHPDTRLAVRAQPQACWATAVIVICTGGGQGSDQCLGEPSFPPHPLAGVSSPWLWV